MCSPCCHDFPRAKHRCCHADTPCVSDEIQMYEELKRIYIARIEALDERIASLRGKGSNR